MATNEADVIAALASFGEDAAAITTAALRVLAFSAHHEVHEGMRKGDYARAQEAAYALLQTLEVLERRAGAERAAR